MGKNARIQRRLRRAKAREQSHIRNRVYEFNLMKAQKACYALLNDIFDDDDNFEDIEDIDKLNRKLMETNDEPISKISDDTIKLFADHDCNHKSNTCLFSFDDGEHQFNFSI
jgi:hypothetical protein